MMLWNPRCTSMQMGPMGRVSMVKTKLKNITAGIWDMLKRLTGPLASSVVKTPATVAPRVAQEPEVDPEAFPESVPERYSYHPLNIIGDSTGKRSQKDSLAKSQRRRKGLKTGNRP